MILYGIEDPVDLNCARVAPVGEEGYIACDTCGYYTDFPKPSRRTVEWLEGSSIICPFVWPARLIAEVLVTTDVRESLPEKGIEYLPVEFYQDPKLAKPKRMTKRARSRVWLPYEGPPLYSLWVATWIHVDPSRSSLHLTHDCTVCGRKAYEVEGVERREFHWDPMRGELVRTDIPRVAGKGVYVSQKELQGAHIFRSYEGPGRILCTEVVKDIIEEKQFGNVWFLELGEVI
jgi:hypothetical protein